MNWMNENESGETERKLKLEVERKKWKMNQTEADVGLKILARAPLATYLLRKIAITNLVAFQWLS